MARYYQYYCAKKILCSVKEKKQKGGVIWHTTGSGKSLTMIFSVGKILTDYPQSTILVVTDRQDLYQQLYGFFTEFSFLVPHESIDGIQSIQQLVKLLKKPNRGKAHRSQNLKFQEDRFSYARIMRQIFPEAYFFAWTGTPINTEEKSTYMEFDSPLEPLHSYSTKQAIDDQIIINQIFYQHYPLSADNAFQQMISKIKADYENLKNQKNLLPKFLVMVKDKSEGRKFYELFIQDENYKEVVCLIISPGGDITKNIDGNKEAIQKFKKNNFPNIAIVVNMLTTGFDLPSLRVIYIAKKINSPKNNSTLKEAKEKYFGSGDLQLISSTEVITDCLAKLRQMLAPKEKASSEEITGYLLKNKKEREFKNLVKKIEEVSISLQKEINEDDNIFFLTCRKIAASLFRIITDLPKIGKNPQTNKNLSPNKPEEKSKKDEHIYDEEHYYLYTLLFEEKRKQLEKKLPEQIETELVHFTERLVESFQQAFHNNPDCFLLNEAYGTAKLEKLFDKVYFEECNLLPPKKYVALSDEHGNKNQEIKEKLENARLEELGNISTIEDLISKLNIQICDPELEDLVENFDNNLKIEQQ
ncbi:3957_t:CDS:2 [Ambispora leptoticha]|uniref:3957_t:CDS:1 n=1 Tax=Ambispora leptoticha TaxID=144679 RepID=A0A9N8VA39_9GLOM|nr:3957_t:CDS:2 [Ambispora leptoticha]